MKPLKIQIEKETSNVNSSLQSRIVEVSVDYALEFAWWLNMHGIIFKDNQWTNSFNYSFKKKELIEGFDKWIISSNE
jgi:hypothetical protein